MICHSRLGPWNTALPATFHLLYIVYSISCKMSIIPTQSFHLTLTDSQTIKKRSIMAIRRLWTFFQSKGTLSTEKRYVKLPRKIKKIHCRSRLSLATKVVCSATMYPYIIYSINCKMSIITIQNFHLMLISRITNWLKSLI